MLPFFPQHNCCTTGRFLVASVWWIGVVLGPAAALSPCLRLSAPPRAAGAGAVSPPCSLFATWLGGSLAFPILVVPAVVAFGPAVVAVRPALSRRGSHLWGRAEVVVGSRWWEAAGGQPPVGSRRWEAGGGSRWWAAVDGQAKPS